MDDATCISPNEILENVPDAVVVLDRQGRVTYLNAAATARLSPGSRNDWIGRDFWTSVARPAGSKLREACTRAVAENTSVEFDEHDAPAGRWTRVHVRPTPKGLVLHFQDITDSKSVEERLLDANAALLESEQRFRFLTDVIPPQVWTARPDGSLDYVNRRVLNYFGRSFEEMVGDGWRDFVHPDDLTEAARRWTHSLRTGERYETEFRLRRTDGTYRWHIARADALRDSRGRIVKWFGTNSDITDLKAAEESLRRSNEELEQRVRERTAELQALNEKLRISNRELEDFASVASHDLQEPLRKIRAFGDRLVQKASAAMGPEGQDYLQRMQNAAARMQTLISDLLSFSRVTTRAQPFAPVDLNVVADEVMSDLEARVQQTNGRVHLGPLPAVEADRTQMRQLLQNLIGNALKFSNAGVPPEVRVGTNPRDEGGTGEAVELYVADNGIGFDEKYLDRVFTVFQRLHGRGAYEGNGIGLAVCRKIVERHGGTITARSRPGEGATFLVTLPVRQPRLGGETSPANEEQGGLLDVTGTRA